MHGTLGLHHPSTFVTATFFAMVRSVMVQVSLAVAMAFSVVLLIHAISMIFPDAGWHLLPLFYLLMMVALTMHYWLTSRLWWPWIAVSFLLNFPIWFLEQFLLDLHYGDSMIYRGNIFLAAALGGVLWALNKLVIDALLLRSPSVRAGLRKAILRWAG